MWFGVEPTSGSTRPSPSTPDRTRQPRGRAPHSRNVTRILPLVSPLALVGCAAIRGGEKPKSAANLAVATQYWFRGVPQSEELVAQGDASVTVPFANGDSFAFTTWGNYQLSNSTGNAAFADRSGGDFTEIDLIGAYATKLEDASVVVGVISYNFPNAVGVSTHELFASATFDNEGLSHTIAGYYDVDQADDFYLNYGLGSTFTLDERFTAKLGGAVGFMSEDQAAFYFGADEAGLSDASITGLLDYKFDEYTNVYARAAAITVPDPDLRDASEARGFKTSTVVFTFGISWSL